MAKHKQTPKKAVKKSSAKKSTPKVVEKILIDGLYSHKFNCRILPDSGKAMEQIMKDCNLKSFNKAINLALLEHTNLKLEIVELKKQIRSQLMEATEMESAVTNFKNAFKCLNELKVVSIGDAYENGKEKLILGEKRQSKIGECESCGADDEPVYEHKGSDFCEMCLRDEI